MRLSEYRTFMLAGLVACSLGVAACGSDDSDDSGSSGSSGSTTSTSSTPEGSPAQGKQGGKLTVLASDDVDFIDPGATYYQFGFMITSATQKPLYSFKPSDPETPVPDLAEGKPQISEDAKTVTVKIKPGVRFSPPVNRDVTAKDVKYAIERGFFASVANGYAGAYFGNLDGAKVGVKSGTKIKGITTPDDRTIVFNLTKPTAGTLAGALSLPLSAPVPEEYAAKFDKKSPSTYGENQVATGPYMIENNAKGKAIGYSAGKRIHLVRNPNWDKAKDYKPAHLDEIDIPEGNDDTTVAARRIIDGQSLVNGDFAPPPEVTKQIVTRNEEQLSLAPSGGGRYVSLNTKVKPFDDINVRKAVSAGYDRNAHRLTRGGPLLGDMPTHFLPPNIPGFDEAGGLEGPGLDFLSKPDGDMALAAEYFRKAGFASGKYEGNDEILMVGTTDGVAQKGAEVAKQQFEKMGFKVTFRLVTQDAMYTRYCNVPKAKVAVCPNVGWFKDFPDAQTLLDPTFNGKNILPENNSNWPQLDVPEVNQALDKAAELTDPEERAAAYGAADKLITEQAPSIPWIWDKTPNIRSKNVNGVVDAANSNWSLTHTSLK